MKKSRVVLDTNILVSALMTPLGNPAKVYKMFFLRMLELVYCEEIIAEYEDVLYRPRLRIPAEAAETILAAIRLYGESVVPITGTDDLPHEDDRVFFDTAKSAGAFLITGNTKHYPKASFIHTPTSFLELLTKPSE